MPCDIVCNKNQSSNSQYYLYITLNCNYSQIWFPILFFSFYFILFCFLFFYFILFLFCFSISILFCCIILCKYSNTVYFNVILYKYKSLINILILKLAAQTNTIILNKNTSWIMSQCKKSIYASITYLYEILNIFSGYILIYWVKNKSPYKHNAWLLYVFIVFAVLSGEVDFTHRSFKTDTHSHPESYISTQTLDVSTGFGISEILNTHTHTHSHRCSAIAVDLLTDILVIARVKLSCIWMQGQFLKAFFHTHTAQLEQPNVNLMLRWHMQTLF